MILRLYKSSAICQTSRVKEIINDVYIFVRAMNMCVSWWIPYKVLMLKVCLNCCYRWVSNLQQARVTRWGGMISTPDAVLQAVIKRALMDSGCPSHIVTELMENAHERRWPPGLSTLETRQLNRRQYENYVTKRIPGNLWEVSTFVASTSRLIIRSRMYHEGCWYRNKVK